MCSDRLLKYCLEVPKEVDGIIAGLPCPPFSLAGKQKASFDSRKLFGEFKRILRCVEPQWAIVENVPGLITAEGRQFFRAILWQFTSLGFDVEWGVFSAASVGAVHKRERIWIIAYSQSSGRDTSWYQRIQERTNLASVGCGDAGNSQKHRLTNSVEYEAFSQPASSRGDDGRTAGLDRCLLTHAGLDYWLTSATIPSFNRLTRSEVAALTPDCQKEYRQLYTEYQSLKKAKSKWGTQALEKRFRRKFPHLRILRIDSESVADPISCGFRLYRSPERNSDPVRFSYRVSKFRNWGIH